MAKPMDSASPGDGSGASGPKGRWWSRHWPFVVLAAIVVAGLMLLPSSSGWVMLGLRADVRSNLGAALIGGAVIGMAILLAEQAFVREQRRRDERHALWLQLALTPDHTLADLHSQDLGGIILSRHTFYRATLIDANLAGGVFRFTDFKGADLSGARLDGADLAYAKFFVARLPQAHLTATIVTATDFTSANLTGADFTDARGDFDRTGKAPKFTKATLTGAILKDAVLIGARFSDATCQDADFTGATLLGAHFGGTTKAGVRGAGATISGADFTAAKLDGVRWGGVRWDPSDPPKWPEGFEPPDNAWEEVQ